MPKPKGKSGETKPVADDFFSVDFSPPVFNVYQRVNDRRIKATTRDMPARLYHYTNAGGLLGIIEHNALWATHIDYLNDAAELRYARGLVEEAITQHEQAVTSAYAQQFLQQARTIFDVSKTMDVFVSCFCEQGDLLSQWRGYAQAGEGYSIGVDSALLGQIGGGLNFFFGNVVYDRETQDMTVNDVLGSCVEAVNLLTAKASAADASSIVNEMCRVFRRVIWMPLVTFKDATFAEENEWRAIEIMSRSETATRARFRSTTSKVIPYIELDFSSMKPVPPYKQPGKIPIKGVFHGPTLNPDLSARALRLLLTKHEYPDAEVKGSRIPLRL